MGQVEILFTSSFGDYQLQRFPLVKKQTLRAWDAADEYLLNELHSRVLLKAGSPVVIVNDSFGALAISLHEYKPLVITDSYLSMQGIWENVKRNRLDEEEMTVINSLESPADYLNNKADIVLIKLPKSLAMLEDQLIRLRSCMTASTVIIAAAMTRHIHNSTLSLFESIIGPTTTSLARKKARLINCEFIAERDVTSHWPKYIQLPYEANGKPLSIMNHAGVFSSEKLDIGTRLLIDSLPESDRYKTIVDLGCGNGIVGIMAAIKNPAAKLVFTDESYMAVDSAMHNFEASLGEGYVGKAHVGKDREVEFLQTDCLSGVEPDAASLVLCNPPFHQSNAVTDNIAWQMFSEARKVLHKKGELWVIGNHHLAYHAKVKHLFGNCENVTSNKKFSVIKAVLK